jgi:hypothetical protein
VQFFDGCAVVWEEDAPAVLLWNGETPITTPLNDTIFVNYIGENIPDDETLPDIEEILENHAKHIKTKKQLGGK